MSYLHSPRLVFSGDFLSDVSTVNNDPAHYNNATFQSSFQDWGQGSDNGWWNPEGGATFSFQNCSVSRVVMDDGRIIPGNGEDIVIGQIVCGPAGRNSGKMVDLDPQAQMNSELWGIKLRLLTKENELLMEGTLSPTGFRDLQTRQTAGTSVNGQGLGGTWTTVLYNVEWGKRADDSRFLCELRAKSHPHKLSLNLNAFGYYYNHAPDGRFSMARILGAIGPWHPEEPVTFAPARRLYGILTIGTGQNAPVYFSYSNFLFEKEKNRLTIDFGSSFPISNAMGNIKITEKLYLGVSKIPLTMQSSNEPFLIDKSEFDLISELVYETGPDWLNNTGGIFTCSNIPENVASQLDNQQLILFRKNREGQIIVIARETIGGILIRADNFVNRLDADEVNNVRLYAYLFGKPYNTGIAVSLQPPTPVTPVGPTNPICEIPGNNYPIDGLSFSPTVTTGDSGLALLAISGSKLYSPRIYIDGQIYYMNYQLNSNLPGTDSPTDGAAANDYIVVHLRDYFAIPENPVWADIQDTMTQFSNLYPIMSKYLVDLKDPNAVIAKREILKFAFSQDIHDPIYMPVTRDLSEGKKRTILKWLEHPIVEGTALRQLKNDKVVHENPVAPGQPLTNWQAKLKLAVMMKNGSGFKFLEVENLF